MKPYKQPSTTSCVGENAVTEATKDGPKCGPGMGKGTTDPSRKMSGPVPPEDNIKSSHSGAKRGDKR